MARIGFIGLGNMGEPMAANLVRAGHVVRGYDVVPAARLRFEEFGGRPVDVAAQVLEEAEAVITMLPEGEHVRAVYLGPTGLIARAEVGTLLIDCSTIDIETSRAVHRAAADAGHAMIDAPVSGGVHGAAAATLTFMVGGEPQAFAKAQPLLAAMGKAIVHAGPAGTGQAAKICNNMILGISMIAISEAFTLAEKLGLAAEKLFAISSNSSGQCWCMTNYCPVPGLVPSSPANRGYAPGFTTAMMLKDLKLAQQAAMQANASTPLGAEACQLYGLFAREAAALDFSGIIKMIGGEKT